MSEIKCVDCQLRTKYDAKPKSFTGRFWKWHISFCPGWSNYFNALERSERDAIKTMYNLK